MLEEDYHKQKILQIVPALNCGGVERGTIDIARGLIENGFSPYVLSNGGSLVSKLNEISAKFIYKNVGSKNPLVIYKNINVIKDIILNEKIDLVHSRSRAPAWSAHFATKKTGTPHVTTFHGIYSLKSSFKQHYNSVMAKGARVIAVSNFVKSHILSNYKVNEDIIRVIHRGVDLNYFNPANISQEQKEKLKNKYNITKSQPIILLPARFTRWKGQDVLIEALNLIKLKDFYCIMVGDLSKHPNYVKRLSDRILELKLQGKVKIFGTELDVVGLYSLADVVLSTSIEPEAFGRTIVEAQAMEKIVIATDIGGSAETIINGSTGFHVRQNDYRALADSLKNVLDMLGSAQAEKITTSARINAAEHFGLKNMQDKTIAVYKELL